MGNQSITNPKRLQAGLSVWLLLLAVIALPAAAQTAAPATSVPLLLPAGLAYDRAGNLLFAESGRNLVRRVSPGGLLTTVAGTGTQGFGGDGGPATMAELDSPAALALDAAGDLFIADTHNHRVRRVDAATGTITTLAASISASALAVDAAGNVYFADLLTHRIGRIAAATGSITTVAGNGTQGFSGDGGPALSASLDSPGGLALSSAGDLWIADSHNHRVRRVDHATGIISTATASARLPRGLVLDASGNLLFADAALQQVLRVDLAGAVSVVAGNAVQTFAGDGGLAPAASLDAPRAVTLSPGGLPTLADSANGRIRQVDSASIIHTLAGLGPSAVANLTLSAPSVLLYGSGTVVASLAASPATGAVTLFDTEVQASPQSVGSEALVGNVASFSASGLAAGPHRLLATYAGDTLHSAAESSAIALSVSPVQVTASPASLSLLYGQPVPTLSGTLTGILPQDTAGVSLALTSTAGSLSPPGVYPITATLAGSEAGNYTLTTSAAVVRIAKAPAVVTLSPALVAHVASSTSGLPTGTIALLDGTSVYASLPLSAGAAAFSPAGLSAGSHSLTASYAGDTDFLAATSTPVAVTIAPIAPVTLPDFTLVANGQTTATVQAGSAAQYSFAVTPVNGTLSSPILLSATGLPPGATATFNPAYLPPSSSPAAFVLTIATPKADLGRSALPYGFALFLPVLLLLRRRRRVMLALMATVCTLGCGDRVGNFFSTPGTTTAYTIMVIGTTTQATGAALQHTATVTLNLQH